MSSPTSARLTTALLLAGPLLPAARPDALLLKDGKALEGTVTDKGGAYEIKTKYGTLTIDKAEVRKVLPAPDRIAAEADVLRKVAAGLCEEAAALHVPAERNRKLSAARELLDKARLLCAEADGVYTGPDRVALDKAAAEIAGTTQRARELALPEPAAEPPPAAAPPPAPLPPAVAKAADPGATPAVTPANPAASAELGAPALPTKKDLRDAASMPPPAPKTAKELVEDLASPDAAVRKAAADGLAQAPVPEALPPLLEALRKESDGRVIDALELALLRQDVVTLLRQDAVKALASGGTPEQKAALVHVLKRLGGEPAVRFLIDQFVMKGDEPLRLETASALKKHKAIAVRLLIEAFRKAPSRLDLQVDIIKLIGIIGESAQGARFLLPFLETEAVREIAVHALLKIDRPAIPVLLQYGLSGGAKTRNWSAQILRHFMNIPSESRSSDELTRWWVANRRDVEAEEAAREKRDAELNWPVDEHDWAEYDRPVIDRDGNELRAGRYRALRERTRRPMMDATLARELQDERARQREERIKAKGLAPAPPPVAPKTP